MIKILEFLRKIFFLKGLQIYQNYLCALTDHVQQQAVKLQKFRQDYSERDVSGRIIILTNAREENESQDESILKTKKKKRDETWHFADEEAQKWSYFFHRRTTKMGDDNCSIFMALVTRRKVETVIASPLPLGTWAPNVHWIISPSHTLAYSRSLHFYLFSSNAHTFPSSSSQLPFQSNSPSFCLVSSPLR